MSICQSTSYGPVSVSNGKLCPVGNKTIGIIVKNDESDPRTPTIRILLDEKLRPVQQYSSLKIQPGNTPGIN